MRHRTQTLLVCMGFGLLASVPLLGDPVMAESRSQSVSIGYFASETSAGELVLASESGGVRVRRVRHDAIETLLQDGDLITRMDGSAVAMPEDVMRYVRARPQLGAISLTVRRGGSELDLTVDAALLRHFMPPQPPAPPEPPA